MKSKLLFLVLVFIFPSCGLIILKVADNKNRNACPMDTEGMDNIESPYNLDNTVYRTNRRFLYEVYQQEKGRSLKFKLELVVMPGVFNLAETKIKYNYYYSPEDLSSQELIDFGYTEPHCYQSEYTSLSEEQNNVQLHPPRTKTLMCLERAPFPELPYPICKGSKRKGLLYIPKGNWGELAGSRIKWKYVIDSVSYKNDTLPYYCHVQSSAESKKGGYNTLEMDFTADSGFTRLSYRFQDLTCIDFILKEIK